MAAVSLVPSALAQTTPDYARAYQLSLECFVAYAVSMDEPAYSRTAADRAANDRGSRVSFDAAMKLGKLQGFDNPRLNADLDRMQADYVKVLLSTPGLLAQKRAECQRMGLQG